MKYIALAPLAALIASAPALAAEFSGPFVEAHAGWDRANVKISDATSTLKGRDNGTVYGAGAGYDFRRGNTVFGIDANIDDANTKECVAAGTERACIKAGRDLSLGGRIGYVVAPKALIYAKAAYTNVRIGATYTDSRIPANNFSGHDERDGYRIGGGVEYAVTANAFVKAEYRYSDYKDYKDSGARIGVSRHQVLGAIGYRF